MYQEKPIGDIALSSPQTAPRRAGHPAVTARDHTPYAWGEGGAPILGMPPSPLLRPTHLTYLTHPTYPWGTPLLIRHGGPTQRVGLARRVGLTNLARPPHPPCLARPSGLARLTSHGAPTCLPHLPHPTCLRDPTCPARNANPRNPRNPNPRWQTFKLCFFVPAARATPTRPTPRRSEAVPVAPRPPAGPLPAPARRGSARVAAPRAPVTSLTRPAPPGVLVPEARAW